MTSCNSELDDSKSSGSITSGGANGGGSLGGTIIPPGSPGNPSTPNTLLVKAYSNSVLLAWTPPGKAGPYSYGVYRRTATGSFQQLANSLSVSNFNDTTALNGIAYTYKVRATNSSGNSSDTNEAQAEAIASFSITSFVQAASNDVTITWTPGAGAEKYDIVTGTGNGDFNTVLLANASSPAVLTGLAPGSTYQIQIIAKNSVGLGAEVRSSTVVRAVLMSAFTFTLGANAQGLSVTWPVVTGADRYQVLWGTSTGNYTGSVMVNSPATATTLTGLTDNTTYYVMMYAYGGSNKFAASAEVSLLYGAPVSMAWLYTSGTTTQYTSSSGFANMSFSLGGVCTLGQAVFVDQNNTATGFGGGTSSGLIWDATNSYFRLGNAGGCDGSTRNCETTDAELNATWTPQWSNLVGYWKFNETAAGTAPGSKDFADSSASGFHGTKSATGVTFGATGKVGNGVQLDGTTGYVTVADAPALKPTAEYSSSVWIYPTNVGNNYGMIMTKTDSTGATISQEMRFQGTSGKVESYIRLAGAYYNVVTPTALTNNKWYHIIITYKSSSGGLSMYLNGDLVANNAITGAIVPSSSPLYFGRRSDGYYYAGRIDEAAWWNKALTAAEAKSIYEHQISKFGATYVSRTFDAGSAITWPAFDWTTKLPYGKELPDGGASSSESTSAYASLASTTLMSGNLGLWHLNEPVGTSGASSVKDTSGSAYHGTPSNVTFGGTGRFQTSALFNGSTSFVTFPSLTLTNKVTYTAWVKIAAHKNYNQIMMQINAASNNYMGMIVDSNGKLGIQMYNSTVSAGASTSSTSVVPSNEWAFVAVTYDGTLGSANQKMFINGVQDATTATYTGGLGAGFVGNPFEFGRDRINAGRYFNGSIDEAGVWNRALTATEILQLYRRGVNRLKFQIRTCSTVNAGKTDCTDGSAWQGPGGNVGTYFSELNNNTAALAMNGTVKNTAPSMLFSDFTSPPTAKRYFQYRVVAESDDSGNLCNYGAGAVPCSPEIVRANINATGYDFTGPSIYGNTGLVATRLSSIAQTLGAAGCAGGVGYNLSLDKMNWFYSNGTAWLVADGTAAKSANLTTTNAGLSSFGVQVGIGTVYVRAFLISNGSQPCEIDSITLNGKQ